MRENITIPLTEPLKGPNNTKFDKIVLREPTFDEYLAFDDPYTVMSSNEGTPYVIENMESIRNYISRCLVEPKDPALLSQAGVRVGQQVKRAMLSFFQPDAPVKEDPSKGGDSKTSQTSSPSGASGAAASKTSGG
jgi:hypothetical protein